MNFSSHYDSSESQDPNNNAQKLPLDHEMVSRLISYVENTIETKLGRIEGLIKKNKKNLSQCEIEYKKAEREVFKLRENPNSNSSSCLSDDIKFFFKVVRDTSAEKIARKRKEERMSHKNASRKSRSRTPLKSRNEKEIENRKRRNTKKNVSVNRREKNRKKTLKENSRSNNNLSKVSKSPNQPRKLSKSRNKIRNNLKHKDQNKKLPRWEQLYRMAKKDIESEKSTEEENNNEFESFKGFKKNKNRTEKKHLDSMETLKDKKANNGINISEVNSEVFEDLKESTVLNKIEIESDNESNYSLRNIEFPSCSQKSDENSATELIFPDKRKMRQRPNFEGDNKQIEPSLDKSITREILKTSETEHAENKRELEEFDSLRYKDNLINSSPSIDKNYDTNQLESQLTEDIKQIYYDSNGSIFKGEEYNTDEPIELSAKRVKQDSHPLDYVNQKDVERNQSSQKIYDTEGLLLGKLNSAGIDNDFILDLKMIQQNKEKLSAAANRNTDEKLWKEIEEERMEVVKMLESVMNTGRSSEDRYQETENIFKQYEARMGKLSEVSQFFKPLDIS